MLPSFPSYHSNGYHSPSPLREPRNKRGRYSSRGRSSHMLSSYSFPLSRVQQPPADWASSSKWEELDAGYFHSYSHLGIHEEMIKDHVRTETYRAAIQQHQNSISGKVVLDVGCGTGILSVFCALAGARKVLTTRCDAYNYEVFLILQFTKEASIRCNVLIEKIREVTPYNIFYAMEVVHEHKVYAVEASEIAVQADEVVKANNLSEKVIVLHEKIENVIIEEKVDVIISEWMGYMLLYESMLSSVIFARDRWLKPGGLILPSHATLYMAPVTHSERYHESIDFWRNVYGIDMSVILPLAKQCAFEEPSIETISAENILSWPFVVKGIDCYTVTAQELESITTRYRFASMLRAPLHGFAFWFDVEFNGPATFSTHFNSFITSGSSTSDLSSTQRTNLANSNKKLLLSTAPEDEPTHWQQTIIYFYEPIEMTQDQIIEGSITLSQSMENPRFLNIHLEYSSGCRSFVKESIMR